MSIFQGICRRSLGASGTVYRLWLSTSQSMLAIPGVVGDLELGLQVVDEHVSEHL